MSIFEQFQSDPALERDGVVFHYDQDWVKVAYAGGFNREFNRVLEAKRRPFLREIATEQFDDEAARQVLMETYAETAIKGWGNKALEAAGEPGIIAMLDGTKLSFSPANVLEAFKQCPHWFLDIARKSSVLSNYRTESLKDASKN